MTVIQFAIKKAPTAISDSGTFYVGASSDDGYHYSGVVNTTVKFFNVGNNNWPNFVRFSNLTIPQNATINNAYIRGVGYNTATGIGTSTIHGNDIDNAIAPTTVAQYNALVKTSANISWSISSTTAGVSINSPDLSTIIQEIVNRPGWSSGNAIQFLGTGTTSTSMLLASYDHDSYNPLELHVEYTYTP
jgi:hypothetical protein